MAMSSVSPKMRYRCCEYAMTWVLPPETYNTIGFDELVMCRPISMSGVSAAGSGITGVLTANTVVDADEGDVVQQRQGARDERADLERCAHSGAWSQRERATVWA